MKGQNFKGFIIIKVIKTEVFNSYSRRRRVVDSLLKERPEGVFEMD